MDNRLNLISVLSQQHYISEESGIKMYSCLASPDDFYETYAPQTGGGSLVYKASYARQKGYGIGGIFGAIARRLIPFVQTHILPHAKRALKNIALDVLDNNRSFKESLRENVGQAIKASGKSMVHQTGSGRRKRRRHPSLLPLTKKRKTTRRVRKNKTKKTVKRKTRSLFLKNSLFD